MGWTRRDLIEVGGGEHFGANLMLPASGQGPGVLVLQEIFGVTTYIADVAERLAADGYVAMAPDVFWRTEHDVALEGNDEVSMARAMALGKGLDVDQAVDDISRAMSHLRGLPETTGRVGVVGFCLGGTLAYLLAARHDPAVCISYYGSGVPKALHEIDGVRCPAIFHFGADDPVISAERVDAVRAAAESEEGIEVHVLAAAGHAFDNHHRPDVHAPDAAKKAWAITAAALAEHLRQ